MDSGVDAYFPMATPLLDWLCEIGSVTYLLWAFVLYTNSNSNLSLKWVSDVSDFMGSDTQNNLQFLESTMLMLAVEPIPIYIVATNIIMIL